MSADLYDKCMFTCRNNDFEADEIEEAGLTAVKAEIVKAPMIEECFMNLECRYKWEKELAEGDETEDMQAKTLAERVLRHILRLECGC